MMSPARLGLLALAQATVAIGLCLDGPTTCNLELNWQVTATDDDHTGTIEFTATCLSQTPGTPLTWCAFGISPTGGMYPAGIFMLQALNGTVWLEDRQNVGYQSPTCMVPQLSTLFSSSVSASGDNITAVWSRPIELNSTLLSAGYLDIPAGPTTFIGALLSGAPPPSPATPCQPLAQHNWVAHTPVSILPIPPAGQLCVESECLSTIGWSYANGIVAFSATCSTPGQPINWCAFGLSPTGAMIPSEAWVLQADPSSGAVYLEDRNLTVYGSPPCYPTQASTLVYSYTSPSRDTISATWTRAASLSPALLAQGYVNFAPGPSTVIAAMLSGVAPTPFASCRAIPKHNVNGALAVNITLGPGVLTW